MPDLTIENPWSTARCRDCGRLVTTRRFIPDGWTVCAQCEQGWANEPDWQEALAFKDGLRGQDGY